MIIRKILDTCPEAARHYRKDNIKEKKELKTEMESNQVTTVLQNRTAPETATRETERKKKSKEKVDLMLMWASNSPDIVQIRKLIAPLEDWEGNMWSGPWGNKPGSCP